MKAASLVRHSSGAEGTFGALAGPGLRLATAELPWRDNAPGASCIPPGEYMVAPRVSPRFGRHAHVLTADGGNVLEGGRSWILFHSGNLAGDRARGLRSHSRGCILPGTREGTLGGQSAVLASRAAMRRLLDWMSGGPFALRIDWS